MDKIKISCPHCGQLLRCDERDRGHKVKCPHCKHSLRVPANSPARSASTNRRSAKQIYFLAGGGLTLAVLVIAVGMLLVWPVRVHWPDRRPIGVLFLASNFHSSATNPRGWFNDPSLDVTGPDGAKRFRKALLDYTGRSIEILKRTGAQGVIVWDLEGEQFPHKTTFIGDPRLVGRLAPEMAPVVDELFQRLRDAGLRVGVTIRPQQLVFDVGGQPRQTQVLNIKRTLLEKIDYAKAHWGATLFYVDSTGGILRPDEVWQLRSLAKQRPDILLIPEHHYLPYGAFTAPYVALKKDDASVTANWAQRLFPKSFQALDIGDAASDWAKIAIARSQGDILLFRAWTWSPECQLLEGFAHESH
jgi:phage FluMu protein Com